MKRIALAAFALVALAASAVAQVIPPGTNPIPVGGAYNSSPTTCVAGSGCWFQVDSSGYLKVNVAAGGASGGTSSTFGAAFPATGTAAGMSQGGNMVALTGTANNLNVNCQVGCSGGSFNNNADAVATSATNGQVAAWLYGYNGATYDRLQVNASKELKVADATLLAAVQAPISAQAASVIIGGVGVPSWAGGTLGAMANYGTSPGAVLVPGINAFVTNTVTVSGTVTTTPPSNASTNIAQIGATAVVADPCEAITATYTPISMTTATTLRIVAPTSAKRTYVCYLFLTSAAADNVAIVEGTGGSCVTGIAGVVGGTTAANGLNFAANGGAAFGNGVKAIFATAGTNVDLCLITSAATPLAGHVKWVQAP